MTGQGAHRWRLRVYFEDTDAAGIVYYARYLHFSERARTEALRSLHVPHQQLVNDHGLVFVVRRVKVDYLSPAKLDDELVVVTRVARVAGAAIELLQSVDSVDGVARAKLEVLLVCAQMDGTRPARVPQRWKDALAHLVPAAEQGVAGG